MNQRDLDLLEFAALIIGLAAAVVFGLIGSSCASGPTPAPRFSEIPELWGCEQTKIEGYAWFSCDVKNPEAMLFSYSCVKAGYPTHGHFCSRIPAGVQVIRE